MPHRVRDMILTPPCLPQRLDLVRAKPELRQHLLGLLAEFRRPRRHLARGARQRHRLADQADVAVLRIGHVLRDAEMFYLGVVEHLVDRIDRPAGHAGGVEFLHPGVGGFRHGEFADLRIERVAVLRARRRGGIVGIGHKLRRADRLRATLPDPPAGGGDVDVAVRGLEHAGRNAGRMVVAGLLRHVLFHQPARGLEIQHENLRLQQRGLHPLAFAGDLALQ